MTRAVEVVVLWGDDPAAEILHVGYLAPSRDFALGELLAEGTTAWFGVQGFTVIAKLTDMEPPLARLCMPSLKDQRFTIASIVLHLALLALFHSAPPRPSAHALQLSEVRRFLVVHREEPEVEPPGVIVCAPRWVPPPPSPPTRLVGAADADLIGLLRMPNPIPGSFNALTATDYDLNNALSSLLADQHDVSFEGVGNVRAPSSVGPKPHEQMADTKPARVPAAPREQVEVLGGLPRDTVRRVIGRHLDEIGVCYARALQTRPALHGRVAVKLIIGPTGTVQVAAIVESSVHNPQVEACITSKVKTWSFSAPEGSGIVSVTYPFVLEQVGQ